MNKRRIICVGNSLVAEDAVGAKVYAELTSRACGDQVEIVDGGLGGLDLLPYFEGCAAIVLVDRVMGFGEPGSVLRLEWPMFRFARPLAWSHADGLLYLLNALPFLGVDPMPALSVIGIEGAGDETTIVRAADMALEAIHEIS